MPSIVQADASFDMQELGVETALSRYSFARVLCIRVGDSCTILA